MLCVHLKKISQRQFDESVIRKWRPELKNTELRRSVVRSTLAGSRRSRNQPWGTHTHSHTLTHTHTHQHWECSPGPRGGSLFALTFRFRVGTLCLFCQSFLP